MEDLFEDLTQLKSSLLNILNMLLEEEHVLPFEFVFLYRGILGRVSGLNCLIGLRKPVGFRGPGFRSRLQFQPADPHIAATSDSPASITSSVYIHKPLGF